MNSAIERVVIVGGGTAGWLAACLFARARRVAMTAQAHVCDLDLAPGAHSAAAR